MGPKGELPAAEGAPGCAQLHDLASSPGRECETSLLKEELHQLEDMSYLPGERGRHALGVGAPLPAGCGKAGLGSSHEWSQERALVEQTEQAGDGGNQPYLPGDLASFGDPSSTLVGSPQSPRSLLGGQLDSACSRGPGLCVPGHWSTAHGSIADGPYLEPDSLRLSPSSTAPGPGLGHATSLRRISFARSTWHKVLERRVGVWGCGGGWVIVVSSHAVG